MNKGPLLFLGIFATLAFSWAIVIMTSLAQQTDTDTGLTGPHYDQLSGKLVPARMSGDAKQGQLVYQDLGCVYCHSQQVRHSLSPEGGESVDVARGWGARPNVARDYIFDGRVFLGTMRTGPDLRNVGQRLPNADWHYNHLYDPQIASPGSNMPPHRFLFETREIVGEPSPRALKLPDDQAPPLGYEVVPTSRADALVAYMLSLKTDYSLPEVKGGDQ